jgi:hypothetical protein
MFAPLARYFLLQGKEARRVPIDFLRVFRSIQSYAAADRSVKFRQASHGGQDVHISTDFGVNQAHRISARVDG